ARHRRRSARRARDRNRTSVRRRFGDRARPFRNVADAQGRRRQVERARKPVAAEGHVRHSRWPAVRAGGVLLARTRERGRVHAMELLRQHRGGSRRLPGSSDHEARDLPLTRRSRLMFRSSLLYLSNQPRVFRFVRNNKLAKKFASRFVAGETLDQTLPAVQELNALGITASLDLLGESVTNEREA